MKYKNVTIFFLFVLLFLFRNSVDEFLLNFCKDPTMLETFSFVNDNLEEDLKSLEEEVLIDRDRSTDIQFSKVLYRDPYTFFHTIKILKGTKQNLSLNMAVVFHDSLIGVISSLEENSSYVRLLTNPESSISVRVRDGYGVMTTNDQQECFIDFSSTVLLEVGDDVVTSGLTNIPGNIRVGKVTQILNDDLGLVTRVKVELASTFPNVSYVAIVGKGDAS